MTLLAHNQVEILEIRPPHGRWTDAPVLPEAFLVNTRGLLRRWSNHRFRPTPHRAKAAAPGIDRDATPFFLDASNDLVIEYLPVCQSEDNPPQYQPWAYSDYMTRFGRQYYDHFKEEPAAG